MLAVLIMEFISISILFFKRLFPKEEIKPFKNKVTGQSFGVNGNISEKNCAHLI